MGSLDFLLAGGEAPTVISGSGSIGFFEFLMIHLTARRRGAYRLLFLHKDNGETGIYHVPFGWLEGQQARLSDP